MSDYRSFLRSKSQLDGGMGFSATYQHSSCYDFQRSLVEWSVRQGRASIFADCGLGKTLMQLAWAQNVVEHTSKPVLVLAPLMVSAQTVREAEKFGFDAKRSTDGSLPGSDIVLTNYERLHHFTADDFSGVVCDESSIIKNFEGSRKGEITEFMRLVRYRLLCSATPSPNDYIELGTSSEALGYLGYMDMLGQFFKNDEGSLNPAFIGSKWRFKNHAERDFWRWVCSWARAVRRPSDLGFDDGAFVLPELIETDVVIEAPVPDGELFATPVRGLTAERGARSATIQLRCERAAEVLSQSDGPGVAWCHLNAESEALAAALDGAEELTGSDADERKIELVEAFQSGEVRHLVTKPKIAAFGLNWQHAHNATYFADHSFEQYYQAVRRMWRFGQKSPVHVTMISTSQLENVGANLRRKAHATEAMFETIVREMNDAMTLDRLREHHGTQETPQWL